jgi:hypothetical protein
MLDPESLNTIKQCAATLRYRLDQSCRVCKRAAYASDHDSRQPVNCMLGALLQPPEIQYPLRVELPPYLRDYRAALLRHPAMQWAAGMYQLYRGASAAVSRRPAAEQFPNTSFSSSYFYVLWLECPQVLFSSIWTDCKQQRRG